MAECPTPDVHGNPFRYCPNCDWIEPAPKPDAAILTGTLPSGPSFTTHIEADLIALRVGDKVCVTHPQWMTLERARRTAAALLAVASTDTEEER